MGGAAGPLLRWLRNALAAGKSLEEVGGAGSTSAGTAASSEEKPARKRPGRKPNLEKLASGGRSVAKKAPNLKRAAPAKKTGRGRKHQAAGEGGAESQSATAESSVN